MSSRKINLRKPKKPAPEQIKYTAPINNSKIEVVGTDSQIDMKDIAAIVTDVAV